MMVPDEIVVNTVYSIRAVIDMLNGTLTVGQSRCLQTESDCYHPLG